jgi:P pilus assembly chaperone PapD
VDAAATDAVLAVAVLAAALLVAALVTGAALEVAALLEVVAVAVPPQAASTPTPTRLAMPEARASTERRLNRRGSARYLI